MSNPTKPQLGLVPEGIWLDKLPEPGKPTPAELVERADDIVRAIDRYRAASQAYPSQWYHELEKRRSEINGAPHGSASDSFAAPEPSWATLHRHFDMILAAYIGEQRTDVRELTALELAQWVGAKMREELADGDARG